MENVNQENLDKKPHPKPSEDVQSQIETVTPDTEKNGLSNERKPVEKPDSVKKEVVEDEATKQEEDSISPKDDKGDGIETVSP